MGCSVFPQFLNVKDLDSHHAHAQSQHPEESDQEAMARAIARLAWKQKGHRRLFVYIVVILILLFCASKAHAQRGIDGVQIQNSGGSIVHGYFGGIARLKCSTNINCTYSGGVTTMAVSTAGIAGRPYVDAKADCGLVANGVTDDAAAANACMIAHPGMTIYFPNTMGEGVCSYWFGATLNMKGAAGMIRGDSAAYNGTYLTAGGTGLCFAAGVTGILIDMPNSGNVSDVSLMGSEGTHHLVFPTELNFPSATNLPLTDRSIASIQRASNILTVTITRVVGIEGLTQQVGSTVKISNVVGDATMNGLCIVSALSDNSAFGANPKTFTCAQNGADAGPFTNDGTAQIPTTGASSADGIRVCGNFVTINHVSITNFGRHGINADSNVGHGCTSPFSDDLVVRDSIMLGNQGNGYLCAGADCNAHVLTGDAVYYNVLWGLEDQSSLGNTHIGNQLSNGGHFWAATSTPATKNISTVSRTLVSGVSTATMVLSQANTSLKLGSCIVVAGVSDTSFNTATPPAGTATQGFFINQFTDSTHFQYEQPGAPANASSSGGTVRMGKFSECYLSSGVDDGAQKIQTQSAVAQPVIINQYVEGGQVCKWGPNTLLVGGANTPGCAQDVGDWQGQSITTAGCSGLGGTLCLTNPAFVFAKDASGESFIRAGATTTQAYGFTWLNFSSLRAWGMAAYPTGTLGGSGRFEITSQGYGQTRLVFFGKDNTGDTYINAEGAGAKVYIGKDSTGSNAGTGGLYVWQGGLVINNKAAPTVAANQIGFGSTTASTVGAAGAASALPATPSGYIIVNIAGTNFKIPYYAN